MTVDDAAGASSPSEALLVRPLLPSDAPAVLELAGALTEWFNEAGLRHMAVDLAFQGGCVALAGSELVGFLTLRTYEGVGHISWMGVRTGLHRRGVGSALLAHAEERLRAAGVEELRLETLGDTVDYEPYERTRAFYGKHGFREYRREITDDPGWPDRLELAKDLRAPPPSPTEQQRRTPPDG